VGVSYTVAPDAAKEVLSQVALDTPGVVARPAPQILTKEFADSAVVYECRLWTLTPWRKEPLTDQFLTRAHAALARADMEIPFPQRTLHRARPRPPADTVERKHESLAASELFAGLPEDALAALAESSRLRRYAPGEAVVRKGDASTAVYLVASGEAVVEIGKREVSKIPGGEVFGEMGFLTGEQRSATVRASIMALEVVEIDDSGLRALLEDHSELAEQLAERMVERQLQGEELRDETGAIVSPKGLVSQIRDRFLRLVGRGESDE
jgi:CRP-like cAMP-binding protein